MKIGPRFLHKTASFARPTDEEAALASALRSAPGVIQIDSLRAHHKGGYCVSMEIDKDRLDDFILFMDAQGWMNGF